MFTVIILILSLINFEFVSSSMESDMKLRIIGGDSAESGEFPWIVSLQYDKGGNNTFKHSCAGSIVHPRYIVTAAHCLWNKTVDKFHILAGTVNLKMEEETHQRINVSRVFLHPNYKTLNRPGPFDIAVLQLELDLVFNANVKPIELPEYGLQASGKCTTLGWGNKFMISGIYYDGSDELRKVSSYAMSWKLCWAAYGFVVWRPLQTALCTSGGPFRGSCQGDSGGPVICYKNNTTPYLAGVVSWGWIICGDGLHPDISTDVSQVRGFIDSVISLGEGAPY